jgi:hypothetical protein
VFQTSVLDATGFVVFWVVFLMVDVFTQNTLKTLLKTQKILLKHKHTQSPKEASGVKVMDLSYRIVDTEMRKHRPLHKHHRSHQIFDRLG